MLKSQTKTDVIWGILHPRKLSNMYTQNDGLEEVTPFKIWPFLASMLDFWSVAPNEKSGMINKYAASHLLYVWQRFVHFVPSFKAVFSSIFFGGGSRDLGEGGMFIFLGQKFGVILGQDTWP